MNAPTSARVIEEHDEYCPLPPDYSDIPFDELRSDADFNEAAVREVVVAPLLAALRYGYEQIKHDHRLQHPYLRVGSQNRPVELVPDYSLYVESRFAWAPPFYRMYITERKRSQQHDLLLSLDHAPNVVFYAAPRFHTVTELDDAFTSGAVRPRSFFIRPQAIGALDDQKHHVSFRDNDHVVCSEPRKVIGLRGEELESHLQDALAERKQTLRAGGLDQMIGSVRTAAAQPYRAPGQSNEEFERAVSKRMPIRELTDRVISEATAPPDIGTARRVGGRDKSPEEAKLRALADTAMKVFSSQLFIVQER